LRELEVSIEADLISGVKLWTMPKSK